MMPVPNRTSTCDSYLLRDPGWVRFEVSCCTDMSASDRSVAFSPQWLRDEANRLAQSASPNQQDLTIKLMTPLMSDSERNVSYVQNTTQLNSDIARTHPRRPARA